jgi:hypothetical protein
MLREVILSSVGAEISMATNSLSELPSRSSQEGRRIPEELSRVCCMTGQKGHMKQAAGLFQLAK